MTKWLLRFLAGLVVLVLLWSVVGRFAAWRLEARAERAWAEVLEPMSAFERRFPKAPASEATVKLAELAGRLGIELMPRPDPAAPGPALKIPGTGMEKRTDDEPQPLPKELADLLVAHGADIDAVVAHLNGGAPIAWETDLGRSFEAPIPNLLGQRNLQTVLLARALDAGAKGDAGRAAEALEASWALSEGTRNRAELISALMTCAVRRMELGTLRHIEGMPEAWQGRAVEDDSKTLFLRGLQAEAYMFARALKHDGLSVFVPRKAPDPAFNRYVVRPLLAPYFRLCGADYSARLARVVGELRTQPCGTDVAALNDKTAAAIPRWNVAGRVAMPHLVLGWRAAVSASLSAELTQQVLGARSARASKGGGAWPQERTTTTSATCPGSTWVRARTEDGSVTISLDKVPREWDQPTPPSFRLRPVTQPGLRHSAP